ncbi:MAG: TSUP family transporter [Campylobacteraceae bacterium]|nr:TSUP family transporter [Campylobacteraceae bacterium]
MEFEFYYYVIFVGAGLLAGFVDSIAGGGGIITVPVLMASGMPPHTALATNKLQSSFGSFTASANFVRKGLVSLKEVYLGIIFTFIGALIGTKIILYLDANILNKIIPFMLIFIFIYTLLNPHFGKNEKKSRLSEPVFFLIFGFTNCTFNYIFSCFHMYRIIVYILYIYFFNLHVIKK